MADETSNQREAEDMDTGVIRRPLAILHELPVQYQWEFTRRHPYYLLFWEQAHRHFQSPSQEPSERLLDEAAVLMLTAIGVASDPPSPALGPEGLGVSSLSKAWQAGAISRLTFRGLVGLMMKELPAESRAAIGQFLVASASLRDEDTAGKYQQLREFLQLRDPSLDKMTIAPILGINVNAPLRTIVNAIEQQVNDWKAELGITEHRRRDDKLPEYLRVWDLREGWVDGQYDVRQEKTLHEISRELAESIFTVRNRYQSAFRYLVGHDYRPELWARLFGAMKTSAFIDPNSRPRLATRRPWRSPTRRDVPETVLAPNRSADDHGGTFLGNMAVVQDMQSAADLVMDIETLIGMQYDNDRIAQELEVPIEEINDLIEYVRSRCRDGL